MRFSDRVKILYLSLVILFALGVFFYLLDTWGIIRLEEHIPFLSEEPPIVDQSDDSPTELEIERLQKEEERLKEQELKLQELKASLEMQKAELEKKSEEIEEKRNSLEAEKSRLEEEKKAEINRERMIENMARRLGNMPPDDAVAIVEGWSNADLVDVFLEMESLAEEEGRQSIVPFLMTKLPRERASVITSLMMDERARLLPEN